MARPLRYLPPDCPLVEVTCRTLHGRLLLRPSKELNRRVLGVLARSARLYDVGVSFVFLSDHCHLLVRTLGPVIERNEGGIPVLWQWQAVSLGSGFVAGVVGAGVLTAIVVWRTRAHLAVWMLIGFVVDGLVISTASPPIWFSVVMLAGIPVQASLGYLLARRLFQRGTTEVHP